VNGIIFAVMKSPTEIELVKDRILKQYTLENQNIISAEFVEDVQSEDIFVGKKEIMNIDNVFSILTASKASADVYTVVPDDNLSAIAVNHQMTLQSLLDKNPDVSINTVIRAGQVLNVEKPILPVSVRTVEETTEIQTVPATLEIRKVSDLKAGDTRVVREGKDGTQEAVIHITRINGFLESKTTISTKDAEKMIPQVEEHGE
jgi:LysM repeat protein